MITDINYRSVIGPNLRSGNLNPYWNEYFSYEHDAPELHSLTSAELDAEVDRAQALQRPFLDSQQAISRILTALGSRHNFHRQFNEAFPAFKPGQVLGMQLYSLVARHMLYSVYHPTQHAGHLFPHATYFIPAGDARYERLVRQHGV
jgi:hypothetical protein